MKTTFIQKACLFFTALGVLTFVATPHALAEPKGVVVMFHAGSLTMPFEAMEKAFEAKYPDVDLQREPSGSQAAARKVTDLNRRLIRKWHPDRCREDAELCREMTERLIAAYETLVSYCRDYRFSFAEEEVAKYLSGEDWWLRRFGDDPLWGNAKKK